MKTIIFDLDETLIHCLDEHDLKSGLVDKNLVKSKHMPKFDAVVPIKYSKTEELKASVYIRPGARECLKRLKEHFEIVIFTASHACYANKMIELLDPNSELVTYRLFRDHCHRTSEGVFVKDLRIIANRSLKDVILVDNSAHSYGFQPDNGVPVLPFYNDKTDTELHELTEFLLSIRDKPDIRPVVAQTFRTSIIAKLGNNFDKLRDVLIHSSEY